MEPNILQYTTLPSPLPPPLSPSACDFGEQYASSDDDEILPYKALSTSFAARRRDNASSRSAQAPSTMDLLAEFDRGMETIKKWKASTGEGGSG